MPMLNMMGLAFRLIANRDEIRQMAERILPQIKEVAKTLPDLKDLLEKVAPEVLPDDEPVQEDEQTYTMAWLQESLNKLGADPKLDVDGEYGPATKEAVSEYQDSRGLEVDGWAGAETCASIYEELAGA
jgi:peptidoglycan hydrolase-like protein with peptidoglycan-binding domain